jgi:hypothetical protein
VYDRKSETFSHLQTYNTEYEAIREFTLAVRNPKTMFNQFPEDYSLVFLGAFNTDNKEQPLEALHPEEVICPIQVMKRDRIEDKNNALKQQYMEKRNKEGLELLENLVKWPEEEQLAFKELLADAE